MRPGEERTATAVIVPAHPASHDTRQGVTGGSYAAHNGITPSTNQTTCRGGRMSSLDRGEYAARYGPTTGDRVRLADTDLWVVVEGDDVYPVMSCLAGAGRRRGTACW